MGSTFGVFRGPERADRIDTLGPIYWGPFPPWDYLLKNTISFIYFKINVFVELQ